ncbi:LOB domain-containing protein 2 [Lotus japonicus]|uniref:LOB domain-containing protein 2 n=1 Tax=Lotus japonicus TaxID=34305 RepID=UPI002586C463|nr:LOB domain-containing protein 2 [Lotus japonicus]
MERRTNGTHFACAACKHQRKKCNENCILAPVFPASKTREFHAVHKVFGVSNVTKLVKIAKDEEDRRRVLDSLIWEAMCRQKDPILGPYGEYMKIYNEYKKVFNELTIYKNQKFLLQLPYQGDQPNCVHQDLIALRGGKELNHKGEVVVDDELVNYVNDNNDCVIDSTMYGGYHSNYLHDFENMMRPEVVTPFQQHPRPH